MGCGMSGEIREGIGRLGIVPVIRLERVEQARGLGRALAAGASFAVTPGFNPRVVDACLASGLPVVPGINSPSQVEMALELGLDLLKFFPAEVSGGVKVLASLHGPYLAQTYVAAVGGSWMVREELVSSGSWSEIERLSDEAVGLAKAARGRGRVSR